MRHSDIILENSDHACTRRRPTIKPRDMTGDTTQPASEIFEGSPRNGQGTWGGRPILRRRGASPSLPLWGSHSSAGSRPGLLRLMIHHSDSFSFSWFLIMFPFFFCWCPPWHVSYVVVIYEIWFESFIWRLILKQYFKFSDSRQSFSRLVVLICLHFFVYNIAFFKRMGRITILNKGYTGDSEEDFTRFIFF